VCSFLAPQLIVQVWNVAANGAKSLNQDSFATACRLVALAQAGVATPSKGALSAHSMNSAMPTFKGHTPPASVTQTSNTPAWQTQSTGDAGSVSSATSAGGSTGGWAIAPEDEGKFRSLFVSTDSDKDGYLSAQDAAGLLKKSGLPPHHLRTAFEFGDYDGDKRLNLKEFAVAMQLVLGVAKRGKAMPTSRPEELTAYLQGSAVPAPASSVPVFTPRSGATSPAGSAGGGSLPPARGVMNSGFTDRAAALSAAFDGLGGVSDSPAKGAPTPSGDSSSQQGTPQQEAGPPKTATVGSPMLAPPPVTTTPPSASYPPPVPSQQQQQRTGSALSHGSAAPPQQHHIPAAAPHVTPVHGTATPAHSQQQQQQASTASASALHASRDVNSALEAALVRERTFGKRMGDAAENASAELKQLQAERDMVTTQTEALRSKAAKDMQEHAAILEQIKEARQALAAARSEHGAATAQAEEASATRSSGSAELSQLVAQLSQSGTNLSNLSQALLQQVRQTAAQNTATAVTQTKADQLGALATRQAAAASATAAETAALKAAAASAQNSVEQLQEQLASAKQEAEQASKNTGAADAALAKARHDIAAARASHDAAVRSKLAAAADAAETQALQTALANAVQSLRNIVAAGGVPLAASPAQHRTAASSVALTPAVAAAPLVTSPPPTSTPATSLSGGASTAVVPPLGSTGALEKLHVASPGDDSPAPMAPRGTPSAEARDTPSPSGSAASGSSKSAVMGGSALSGGRPAATSIDEAFSGLDLGMGEEVQASPLPALGGTPGADTENTEAAAPPKLGGATPNTEQELPPAAAAADDFGNAAFGDADTVDVAGDGKQPSSGDNADTAASQDAPKVTEADFDFDDSEFDDAAFEEASPQPPAAEDRSPPAEEVQEGADVAMPPAPAAPTSSAPEASPQADAVAEIEQGGAKGATPTAGDDAAFADDAFAEEAFGDDAFGDEGGVSAAEGGGSPEGGAGGAGADPFAAGGDAAFADDAFADADAAFEDAPGPAVAAEGDDAFGPGDDEFGDDPFA